MNNNPKFNTPPFVIKAGDEFPVNIEGSMIYCLESTGPLFLRIGDNGNRIRFNEGDKYRLPDGFRFTHFYLINETGGSITAQIGVGDGDINIANAVTLTGTATIDGVVRGGNVGANGTVTVGTSAVQVIAANDANTGWIIQNLGAAAIFIGSSNAVTTANGIWIEENGGQLSWDHRGDVYAISGSAGNDVRFFRSST